MSPFGTHLLAAAAAAGVDAEQLRLKAAIHQDHWQEIVYDGTRAPTQRELEALARVIAGRDGAAYEKLRRAMARAAGLIS